MEKKEESPYSRLGGRRTGSAAQWIAVAVVFLVLLVVVADLPHMLAHGCADREHARRMACMGRLRRIALACQLYARENEDLFPDSLSDLLPGYVDNEAVFDCFGVRGKKLSKRYQMERGLRARMGGDVILAYCPAESHHGSGRMVAFLDARVEWMRDAEFQKRLKEQRGKLRVKQEAP